MFADQLLQPAPGAGGSPDRVRRTMDEPPVVVALNQRATQVVPFEPLSTTRERKSPARPRSRTTSPGTEAVLVPFVDPASKSDRVVSVMEVVAPPRAVPGTAK